MIERWFHLTHHGSTIRKEIIAGITTFAAMAYILAVNPAILGMSGMDKGIDHRHRTRFGHHDPRHGPGDQLPYRTGSGHGPERFLHLRHLSRRQNPWQAALGLVFYGGVLFLVLSLTGIRQRLLEAIPQELKLAITCGIGLFIAFIGLKNGGVIVDNPATLVGLAAFNQPSPLMVMAGVVVAAALVWRKVPGAIILTVIGLTILGFFTQTSDGKGGVVPITRMPEAWVSMPASLSPSFLKLDLGYFWSHWRQCLPILLSCSSWTSSTTWGP